MNSVVTVAISEKYNITAASHRLVVLLGLSNLFVVVVIVLKFKHALWNRINFLKQNIRNQKKMCIISKKLSTLTLPFHFLILFIYDRTFQITAK